MSKETRGLKWTMVTSSPSYRRALPVDVAEDLRRARWRANLTLSELGSAVGVCHSTVVRLEHAERAPSIVVAERLIEALGLNERDSGLAGRLREHAVRGAGKDWRPEKSWYAQSPLLG